MAELNTAEAGTRLSCQTVERMICEIWGDYFGREISPYDDFYDLGGDSLGMIDIVGRARGRGLPVRSSEALRNPSPARLAERLTVGADTAPVAVPALCAATAAIVATVAVPATVAPTPVVATGAGDPLHVVHSDSHVEAERDAVAAWESPRPVTGFPLPAGSIDECADRLLAALRLAQPRGPYRLAGFGHGAVLAFEVARRLRGLGADVPLLALIAPPAVGVPGEATREALLQTRVTMLARRFGLGGAEDVEEIHARMSRAGWYGHVPPGDLAARQLSFVEFESALRDHVLADYDGPAVLVHDGADAPAWERAIADLEVHRLDHGTEAPTAVLRDAELALVMRKALEG
jgi:thioesterase domain-containing protein